MSLETGAQEAETESRPGSETAACRRPSGECGALSAGGWGAGGRSRAAGTEVARMALEDR